jgi:hypothetical protein
MPPELVVVRAPFALPPVPEGPFVMLDVAFAGGAQLERTLAFIDAARDRLRLWVDHHEHAGAWPQFGSDGRFILVSSRIAHACPELVTPELVARAGAVEFVLAHHDFDGLMSAVRFLRGGEVPYAEALEDARASDSPGRGHVLSARGLRLADALSEAGAEYDELGFAGFYSRMAWSLVRDATDPALDLEIRRLAADAERVRERAANLAAARVVEAPGVCVLRLEAQLDRRMRREVLSILEGDAAIGLVLEGTPKRYWATAATYFDSIPLESCGELDRGRHDFRFGPTKNAPELVSRLSALARDAGAA